MAAPSSRGVDANTNTPLLDPEGGAGITIYLPRCKMNPTRIRIIVQKC
jgi:hypothetical protein